MMYTVSLQKQHDVSILKCANQLFNLKIINYFQIMHWKERSEIELSLKYGVIAHFRLFRRLKLYK